MAKLRTLCEGRYKSINIDSKEYLILTSYWKEIIKQPPFKKPLFKLNEKQCLTGEDIWKLGLSDLTESLWIQVICLFTLLSEQSVCLPWSNLIQAFIHMTKITRPTSFQSGLSK